MPDENVGALPLLASDAGARTSTGPDHVDGVLAEQMHRMRFICPAAYAAYDAQLGHPLVTGSAQKET
ncbi:hypothetical protein [Streptomyces sp. NPDC002540]